MRVPISGFTFFGLILLCSGPWSASALLPFPYGASQSGAVACLENPSVSYNVYMPPLYSASGVPLPIFYTMYPNGGGMVSQFQTVCASLNIICVGIPAFTNGISNDYLFKQFHAITRDIRLRVLYDPSAEFVGGFSGGGDASYAFSRFRAQHVAGVFGMSAWLGRVNSYDTNGNPTVAYYSTDRVLTNLHVARSTGTTSGDYGAQFFNPFDSNYLASCGAVIADWSFSGGHQVPPDSVKSACLNWLVTNRIASTPVERGAAIKLSTNWQGRFTAGEYQGVLVECVSNLMTRPRTWYAYQAQLMLDQLATNYVVFRSLNVSNLANGDFASDLFYYYAYGAATNNDQQRYYSSLKCLTGVSGANGDRAGDIFDLLSRFGYPSPILQMSVDQNVGKANLWISEDTPGLAYSTQWRTNLANEVWLDLSAPAVKTNAVWSTTVDFDPDTDCRFYRVGTQPLPGTSPSWPL